MDFPAFDLKILKKQFSTFIAVNAVIVFAAIAIATFFEKPVYARFFRDKSSWPIIIA